MISRMLTNDLCDVDVAAMSAAKALTGVMAIIVVIDCEMYKKRPGKVREEMIHILI